MRASTRDLPGVSSIWPSFRTAQLRRKGEVGFTVRIGIVGEVVLKGSLSVADARLQQIQHLFLAAVLQHLQTADRDRDGGLGDRILRSGKDVLRRDVQDVVTAVALVSTVFSNVFDRVARPIRFRGSVFRRSFGLYLHLISQGRGLRPRLRPTAFA